jgi:uncharacterized protein (TIGR03067 family)
MPTVARDEFERATVGLRRQPQFLSFASPLTILAELGCSYCGKLLAQRRNFVGTGAKLIQFTTAVAGVALAVGLVTQGGRDANETAALEGTWQVTSVSGQSIEEGVPALMLTFTGDKYQQAVGADVNERGTFKTDASKKPTIIDFVILEGDDVGKTQLGIIEVSGDTLRASLDTPGSAQRPTDFSVKEGVFVLVAKRVKG